ncbi:MAG: preprotein translocase subunit YajC [Lachnospiraceae bacterium]|nr:preprotein translocase subunit YajC [Lachnospiraceae bacterium]
MGHMLINAGGAQQGGSLFLVLYLVVIVGFMYFIMIRPQRKEQKRMAALLASLEEGDAVLTNSGFYGVIKDITEDTVIVEFGNNKNCRIAMQKSAIAQVEKPGEAKSSS